MGRLLAVAGGRRRAETLAILAAVLALDNADRAAVGAMAPELEAAFHIGHAQVGLLLTVSLGAGALATIPIGALTDRVRRNRLLAASILLWGLAMAAAGASVSYWMLLLSRLALGAVAATAGPTIASLLGDAFRPAERSRVYGFVLTGELVGAGLGFLISGYLAGTVGWRLPFWALAVPAAALSALVWLRLPEPERGSQSAAGRTPGGGGEARLPAALRASEVSVRSGRVLKRDPLKMSIWAAVRYVLSVRTNALLIAASASGYFFFSAVRTFAVDYFHARYHLPTSTATILLVLIGLGAIAGTLTGGRIADRLLGKGLANARIIVAAAAFFAVFCLFAPGLLLPVLAFSCLLFFLGAAALGAANPALDAARLDIMPFRLWGRAEGVRTVLRTAAEALSPVLLGVFADLFGAHAGSALGLQYGFLIFLLPVLAAAALLVLARRSYPVDSAAAIESERQLRHAA